MTTSLLSVLRNGLIRRWHAQRAAGGGEGADLKQDVGSVETSKSCRPGRSGKGAYPLPIIVVTEVTEVTMESTWLERINAK